MKYDFDKELDRKGTDCVKYDLNEVIFGKEEILPMWVADMDFETPAFVKEAVIARASEGVYGYTYRPERYYQTIAGWLDRRHHWHVDPALMDFSPGVVPALVLLLLAYTKPGSKILVQSPVYFPFFSTVKDHDRELVISELSNDQGHYTIDFDDLEAKFGEGVDMMFLCHPHNPVGRAWKMEELKGIAALAEAYDVMVVSDEIHSDLLLFNHTHIPFATISEAASKRTITCIAPSKTFNLAGLHTSVVLFHDEKAREIYKKMLDRLHFGGGNLFGFIALEAAFTHGDDWLDQLLAYLEGNFNYLKERITNELPEIVLSELEATYLAWMDFSAYGLDDEALMKKMVSEAHLGLSDGARFGPGGEKFMRMNIAAPRNVLARGVDQMVGAFKKI